jgi:hypothetical protein
MALDWSQIDEVARFNDGLRKAWNAVIAAASKRRELITKAELREMFLSDPSFLAGLVKVYRAAVARGYDFETDPEGLFDWFIAGYDSARANPLEITVTKPTSVMDLLQVIDAIVTQFKKNIEENRLYEVLYRDDGRPRPEVYAQRLFYATADAYCVANEVELSREPNAGNGPVDFKISESGNSVLVELKLSKNDLVHGYEVQLPAYQASEGADAAVYVIIRVSESDAGIKNVIKLHDSGSRTGKQMPRVYVIDARATESASKRRRRDVTPSPRPCRKVCTNGEVNSVLRLFTCSTFPIPSPSHVCPRPWLPATIGSFVGLPAESTKMPTSLRTCPASLLLSLLSFRPALLHHVVARLNVRCKSCK